MIRDSCRAAGIALALALSSAPRSQAEMVTLDFENAPLGRFEGSLRIPSGHGGEWILTTNASGEEFVEIAEVTTRIRRFDPQTGSIHSGVKVEYLRRSRDPAFTPTYEIELFEATQTPPAPAESGIEVTRNQRLENGDHLVEIASIPGATYAVEYSPDMSTWMRVIPTITAPANRLQWIDNGPPKTHSHPTAAGNRFYRFVLIAAP